MKTVKTRLFVGSIPYAANELTLKEFFEQAGEVVYAKVIKNKETGLSRGFGFIEMADEFDAKAALQLDGSLLNERKIIVKEAFDNAQYEGQKNHKENEEK